MTNFEYLKKQINNMNENDFYNFKMDVSPWCMSANCMAERVSCRSCAINWMQSEYKEPIPELEAGMFVEYYDKNFENPFRGYDAKGYGVIVNDKIVCEDGSQFSKLDKYTLDCITKVFKADCFAECNKDTCIWERN